jgi:HAD superfamily hydrolase (TIGR01490 family)
MNLALFDFDGTITTREMFRPFIEFAVSPRRRALGSAMLAPMVLGYKLGWVSPNLMRRCAVHVAFRGVAEAQAFARGADFAREVLPGVVRKHAWERIQWHQAQGDRVVVVSGALDVYLSHWCHERGLDLLCSRLESRDGTLTGGYRGEQCVNAEKSRRVTEAYDLDRYPVIYAYGDTREDRDLLELAHHRYYQWQEVA